MRITYPLTLATLACACGRYGDYDVNVRSSAIVDNGDPGGDPGLGIQIQWEELDGSLTGNGITNHAADADCARVAASSSGVVYVLWADASSGNGQTYLRAFTDTWSSLAGSADGGGMSQGTGTVSDGTHITCPGSLALDASDNLYAAWQNYDGTQQSIDVRVWNGAAWSGLGGSDVGNGINPGGFGWWPSVIVDGSGRAIVAYELSANPYVVRWQNPWTSVSGAGSGTGLSTSDGNSFIPSLASGTGDELFATWGEFAGADDNIIYAAHWSSANGWVRLGGIIGHISTVKSPPVIVAHGNVPTVSWADGEALTANLHVMQWDGATWQTITSPATSGARPAMQIDRNGHVVLAWAQQDANAQVHAAWFDGSTWQSLMPDGGSISQAATDADGPDIAIDGSNRATIIWRQANDSGVQVLYGRRSTAPIN